MRDGSDGIEETPIVEPGDPFKSCVLRSLDAAPRAAAMDDFGLEEAIDRLGQGDVATVANAARRGLNARLGQPYGVFDRQNWLPRSL